MKKIISLFTIIALIITNGLAQTTGVAINATGAQGDPSAMLDVSSIDKGLLIPRITNSQRGMIINPANGLMVYQTDQDTGFYYNAGLPSAPVWLQLMPNPAANDLNMNLNKITNLAVCTQNLDAANKEYVDNTVGAGGGGPSLADTTYMLCGAKLLPVAYGGTTYTVPTGKIWAIESALYTSYTSPVRIQSINGLSYGGGYIGNYSYSNYGIFCIATPYVLPSGTEVIFNVGDNSSHRGMVSIREYKIVVQ